ncbi:DNA-binding response regulator [Brevibacillus fluminis]|uniref:DNA-binding response regulator n=1 Tax=Brevibacillus fluminis TaxID=511487 RepID=A0A3M8DBW2_9BACL|nr:LytTR family DNA-binding domain-containing protein [Brevibacillus fluminis]RNB85109.1 DNA-binding response regulator [Brevibacillus fluminis]
MRIRVMIAEDERLAREELAYLLAQEEEIELLPNATNGRELVELVAAHEPDVVFLDIKMPEMEGIQAARMLAARKRQPLLVFCTAYENYALEAFGVNAVDYLLKPIEPHRLQQTLTRVRGRLQSAQPPQAPQGTLPQSTRVAKLLLDDGERFNVIDPEAILYAMRDDRVIQIYTATQCYTSKMTLQQLEDKMKAHPFFRIHRSYLVNILYVAEIAPWFNGAYNLTLKDAKRTQLPVSRSYAKELLKLLEGS